MTHFHPFKDQPGEKSTLADMVRLVEFLREHDISHTIDGGGWEGHNPSFTVKWFGPTCSYMLSEGFEAMLIHFIDSNGTAYDKDRNAL